MNTIVRESTIICPSKATPNHTLWLSDIDLTKRIPYTHTPVALIYPHPNKTCPNFFDTGLLKATLSDVLVPFYPVAGRLKKNEQNGRIEIDCNGKGVIFVEIETPYPLADLREFTPNAELRKLVIPTCDYFKGISSIPLLMVQITRFGCGGVVLGFAVHHYLGDGTAYGYFVNSWSSLARGIELTVLPTFDRTAFLLPRNPPRVVFNHEEFQLRPSPPDEFSSDSRISEGTTVRLFKLSKDQIGVLKAKAANRHVNYKFTTYEVVAAHIWRCSCKTHSLKDDQVVKLHITVNGRSRFKQLSVPKGYFGNVMFNRLCITTAGDVVSKPLWHTASKIHETIIKMDDEYAKSAIDYISLQPDVMAYCTGAHISKSPNSEINYWGRMPIYEADFGWGKPKFVRHGGIGYEGQTIIVMSVNGDGSLMVAINLLIENMKRFEKHFYKFTDVISSL